MPKNTIETEAEETDVFERKELEERFGEDYLIGSDLTMEKVEIKKLNPGILSKMLGGNISMTVRARYFLAMSQRVIKLTIKAEIDHEQQDNG